MSPVPDTTSQEYLDTLLRRGVLFSILWLMGIGSGIALYSGLKARRLIRASAGVLHGTRRARWCLVVGGLGLLFWIPIVFVGILNQF
jgi:hypothetical protein